MKSWQFQTGGKAGYVSQRTARDCGLIAAHVARKKNVDIAGLFAPTRSDTKTASARQLAMYLCHVTLQLSMTEVGRYFGRDRKTVSHACAMLEEMRDDPETDAAIAQLEAEIDRDCAGSRIAFQQFSNLQLHHG